MNADGWKRPILWSSVLLAAALLYASITLLVRWQQNNAAEADAERAKVRADREILDRLGGGEMKVLAFYADPPVINRGSRGLLCYGVASAASVRIEPAVEPVNPALSRCIEIKPSAAMKYTLTATDARGRTETRVVEVAVR